MTDLLWNRAWRRAIALVVSAVVAATPALAQDDADEADDESKRLDRVTITGSRIARTETEGPSPVFIIDREQIEREGFTTVEGALRSLTQATGVVQNELFTGGFTQNANSLDLRGLGPGRTLILVDGRRISDYPLPYNGQSNIVNISAIPLAAVDRIEVLSGGASAIYGSDAVAGVVNIILRNDFGNSIDMNLRVGTTDEGGMDSERFQAVGGFLGQRWNVTYALEYLQRDPLYASERDYMDSTQDNPNPAGRINSRNAVEIDIFGSQVGFPTYVDPGNCDGFAGTTVEYSQRTDPVTGVRYYCGSATWIGETSLVNGREQTNFYLTGALELGQTSEAYASFNYFTLDAEVDTGFRFYFNQTPVYASNSNSGSLNQFGLPGAYIQMQRIFTDAEIGGRGAQNGTYEEDVIDYAVGLRGDFFSPLWRYDVYYSSSNYDLERARNLLVEQRVQDYFFLSYDETAADPFGFGLPVAELNYANLYSAVDPSTFNSLRDIGFDTADSSTDTVQFSINGDLFDLPAGPLGTAVVLEWATQEYDIRLDPRLEAGDYFWGLTGTGGGGERDRSAAGLEFVAPLASMVTLTAAGRWDEYDDITNVDGAFTYDVGLEFRPSSKLLIRASQATSFRAPDMHFVFAAPSGFFTNVTDLYLCERDEPTVPIDSCTYNSENISGARQGNPLLREEEGETLTYGFVFEPTEDLYLSIDYYDIELNDLVVDNPLTRILEIEADCRLGRKDPASGECVDVFSRITRNPNDGSLNSERLVNINTGPVNAAVLETSGIDATLQYSFLTERFGSFSMSTTYSHTLETLFKVFPEDDLESIRTEGTRDWRSRVRGSVTWRYKDFAATLFGERFGSALSDANVRGASGRDLGPQMYYNLSMTADVTERASLSLFINNLSNERPKGDGTNTGWPYFDIFNYGFATIGREYFIQGRYRFDY
ncbi:MAG: TonB-dependent receptor [Woeseiaceae bacterium]|nr:TonB-dependent receptor [Woeseiaceae bacterium]